MSKEIKISATRISMFLQCKLKYWFNYVDRLPKLSSPAFKLGTTVHEVLEAAGKVWMKKEKFSSADRKNFIKLYNEVSVREGIEDLTQHKLGMELVSNRLDDFDLGKIIDLEYKFGFGRDNVVTRDGVLLIGAIDKVIELDEDTLLIIDYKTSTTAPTIDQLKDNVQLSIYDLVASLKWPEYRRIVLCLDMLKSEPLYTYRTEEEREEFSDYLKTIHDSMVNIDKKDAKPALNIFCSWCDFKNYCNSYKKICNKTDYHFETAEKYSDGDLINEWQKVRNSKKVLEGRERELAMIMMEKIKRTDLNLYNEKEELYIRQNSRKSYNLDLVHDLVPEKDFLKLVKLNKAQVEKYIKERAGIRKKIIDKAEFNYNSPFLATRKIRK